MNLCTILSMSPHSEDLRQHAPETANFTGEQRAVLDSLLHSRAVTCISTPLSTFSDIASSRSGCEKVRLGRRYSCHACSMMGYHTRLLVKYSLRTRCPCIADAVLSPCIFE